MKPDYKLVAKAKYIHATADLASELWHEVYKRYYPAKQLDTLVEELQSADAIEEDIDNDVNYFLVVLGGKTIGLFGSYGWGDGQWMRDWCERAKEDGAQLFSDEGLICNETPDDDVQAACRKLGADLANW